MRPSVMSRTSAASDGYGKGCGGAEELVRTIGIRLGIEEDSELMNLICDNMKHEFVQEEWQLASLDSFQWQSLGAPIGLAAAVRTLMVSSSNAVNTTTPATSAPVVVAPTGELPSMISTSSVLNETAAAASSNGSNGLRTSQSWIKSRTSLASSLRSSANSRTSANAMIDPINEDENEEEEEERTHDEESGMGKQQTAMNGNDHSNSDSNSHDSLGKKNTNTKKNNKSPCKSGLCGADKDLPPVCSFTMSRALNSYESSKKSALRSVFSGRSFPMTAKFQKALIHAKSGADLKAHTVFVMELNVLAAALFFGAGVELWGSFPMDAVGINGAYVPQTLALVYHFVSCANLIIQLVCTSGWIWSIHATAAVSPHKFHAFFVQTRYAFDNFLFFSEFGQVLLVLNITLLLGAQIAASTDNHILRMIGYYAPIFLLFVGCKFVHTMSSYVGRVAYHGLLLMDDDPEAVGITKEDDFTIQKDGSAARAESEIAKTFNKHNIYCEDSVLDVYRKAKAVPQEEMQGGGMSMFDVIFPATSTARGRGGGGRNGVVVGGGSEEEDDEVARQERKED